MLLSAPAEKLTSDELNKLNKHIYAAQYKIHFVSGGIELSVIIPASWLQMPTLEYPVTIDPTVEILTGYTQSYSTGSGMPYNTLYHDQRIDFLLLSSDLTSVGITAGSTISGIGLYCYSTSGMAISNFRIRSQLTTATTYSAWLTSGWTLNYGPASAGTSCKYLV